MRDWADGYKHPLCFIRIDMKLHDEENLLKPGIYKILNTHNNRIYIGQAKQFKSRWRDHSRSLLNGKHCNRFLRNDFAKCKEELGHDNFIEFYILEVMEGSSKEQRNHREEWWIAQYYDNQGQCYNFKQKTEAKERSCFSMTPEETKQFLSKQSKERWDNHSYRQKMHEIMSSDSVREKLSKAQQTCWKDPKYRQNQIESLAESEASILASKRLKNRWQDPEFRKKMINILDETRGKTKVCIERICQNCGSKYNIRRNDSKNINCKECIKSMIMKRYKEKHGLVSSLERKCKTCGIEFLLKRDNKKSVNCKKCVHAIAFARYISNSKNKEHVRNVRIKHGQRNTEKIKLQNKSYREKNKDKELARQKEYYALNTDKIILRQKEYFSKPEVRSRRNKDEMEKDKTNVQFRLEKRISHSIRESLKINDLTKSKAKWQSIIGYSTLQLKEHLEKLFDEKMSWQNYGSYWHISHIKPKSWFVYDSINHPEFKSYWSLENIRPLEAKENIRKGNRYKG